MDKVKIEKTAFIFDAVEIERLVSVLKYCRHRITYHPEAGINKIGINADFVDYMILNLKGSNG